MEIIRHLDTKIILFDYRGLEDNALVRQIRHNVDAVQELVRQGERNLLRLTDVRDTYASDEIMDAFRQAAVTLKPYFKASAVVGVKGGRKVLLDILNRATGIGVRPFDDMEKAKDWLVEQSRK